MLSDFEQDIVWEAWLAAEIRSGYFATLVTRYQRWQRILVVSGLLLASGATITLLTALVPQQYGWVKPALTVLAALSSLISLVAKNERNAIDCADLHQRWNSLAMGYEELWGDMYADTARERLAQLRKEENAISKSSTAIPTHKGLLEQAQDNVLMHHGMGAAA